LLVSLFLLRPPPSPTLFPYTTLFRSAYAAVAPERIVAARVENDHGEALAAALDLPDQRIVDIDAVVLQLVFFVHRSVHGKQEVRSEEHTSELQSRGHLVCRLLLEKKK